MINGPDGLARGIFEIVYIRPLTLAGQQAWPANLDFFSKFVVQAHNSSEQAEA